MPIYRLFSKDFIVPSDTRGEGDGDSVKGKEPGVQAEASVLYVDWIAGTWKTHLQRGVAIETALTLQ